MKDDEILNRVALVKTKGKKSKKGPEPKAKPTAEAPKTKTWAEKANMVINTNTPEHKEWLQITNDALFTDYLGG
jgi:hypothetical protein